jgi:hypothetical protein
MQIVCQKTWVEVSLQMGRELDIADEGADSAVNMRYPKAAEGVIISLH